MSPAHLVACNYCVKQAEQLLVLLRLHIKVAAVRGGGDSNGDLVLVQVPDQTVNSCTKGEEQDRALCGGVM
jgi:hypothetical protein